MKVICLARNSRIYSCNSYLVVGDWKTLEDVNALIDVGTDGSIIGELERIYTGVGKKAVERVVLTHAHFDHNGGLEAIRRKYQPEVLAFHNGPGIDRVLKNGEVIRLGDRDFQVIHVPGHSEDSICLHCEEESLLFSGDTTLRIMTPEGSYADGFLRRLEEIALKRIKSIYSGHDPPLMEKAQETV